MASLDTAAVAEAFDRVAAAYDAQFGRNPVGLVFRHTVPGAAAGFVRAGGARARPGLRHRRGRGLPGGARRLRPRHRRVGGDGRGARNKARAAAMEAGCSPRGGRGGARGALPALSTAPTRTSARSTAPTARPWAAGWPTRCGRARRSCRASWGRLRCPPVLERALTGARPARGGTPARVGGVPIAVRHPSPAQARRDAGPGVRLAAPSALGRAVPGAGARGLGGGAPAGVRPAGGAGGRGADWPVLRGLGDHVVLEGVRR